MGTNQGSTTFRNSPDVALTADNVYTVSDNGQISNSGGTSCSAPLWAGYTALVNQLAASNGQPPVGFINPVLYSLAEGSQHSLLFNDITTVNNINGRSAVRFSTVACYDLYNRWARQPAHSFRLWLPGTPLRITINRREPGNGGTLASSVYLSGVNATVTATPNWVVTN